MLLLSVPRLELELEFLESAGCFESPNPSGGQQQRQVPCCGLLFRHMLRFHLEPQRWGGLPGQAAFAATPAPTGSSKPDPNPNPPLPP